MKCIVVVILFVSRAAIADRTGWVGFKAPARYASLANQVVLVADLDGDGAPEIIASGNQVEELATRSRCCPIAAMARSAANGSCLPASARHSRTPAI